MTSSYSVLLTNIRQTDKIHCLTLTYCMHVHTSHGALYILTLESFSWYVPDHPGKLACGTCCDSSQRSVGTSLSSAQTQSLHLDTHTSHTGLETQNPIVIRTLYSFCVEFTGLHAHKSLLEAKSNIINAEATKDNDTSLLRPVIVRNKCLFLKGPHGICYLLPAAYKSGAHYGVTNIIHSYIQIHTYLTSTYNLISSPPPSFPSLAVLLSACIASDSKLTRAWE